ncbi:MAG: aminoglycoside phosphotransferase family protein [Defluviitaleaceae bacterium]|nr:aminoglycoside phosphotransferase family protein [Defluviitaleaceae bacterium]
MIKDIYYQKGYPDPVFDNAYVLSLVRVFIPEAKEVTGVDETGGEARTYAIDSDVILKVQRPQQLRLSTSLSREVFFLKQLEGKEGVNVPKVLGYGKEGALEYTVMTRMPGTAVKYTELTQEQRENMLFNLGKMLVSIHNADIKQFYDSRLFPDIDKNPEDIKERLDYLFNRLLTLASQRLEGKTSPKEIDEAKVQGKSLIAKVKNICIVPCHANPGPEHTFVKDGKFSGVIDFGDAYISHPIFDMRRWPIGDREHVINGYMSAAKVDEDFKLVCEISTALDTILKDLNDKYSRLRPKRS